MPGLFFVLVLSYTNYGRVCAKVVDLEYQYC